MTRQPNNFYKLSKFFRKTLLKLFQCVLYRESLKHFKTFIRILNRVLNLGEKKIYSCGKYKRKDNYNNFVYVFLRNKKHMLELIISFCIVRSSCYSQREK